MHLVEICDSEGALLHALTPVTNDPALVEHFFPQLFLLKGLHLAPEEVVLRVLLAINDYLEKMEYGRQPLSHTVRFFHLSKILKVLIPDPLQHALAADFLKRVKLITKLNPPLP